MRHVSSNITPNAPRLIGRAWDIGAFVRITEDPRILHATETARKLNFTHAWTPLQKHPTMDVNMMGQRIEDLALENHSQLLPGSDSKRVTLEIHIG